MVTQSNPQATSLSSETSSNSTNPRKDITQEVDCAEVSKSSDKNVARMPNQEVAGVKQPTPIWNLPQNNRDTPSKPPAVDDSPKKKASKATKAKSKKDTTKKADIPSKIVHNRKQFPYGTAVSMNGYYFDHTKWPKKIEAPTLLGIIQNPTHHDGPAAEELNEQNESYVTFVLSGHCEWNDTAMLNTVSGSFDNEYLYVIAYPPRDTKPIKYRGKTDPLRHFVKGHGQCDLRNHKYPCLGCGSPWCEYKKNKNEIDEIVNNMKNSEEGLTKKEARFKYYVACANVALKRTSRGYRMRLGWCVENIVRLSLRMTLLNTRDLSTPKTCAPIKEIRVIPMSCTRNIEVLQRKFVIFFKSQ